MALDLSKRRFDKGLGRGKIPREVKERLSEEWNGPGNEMVARARSRARRVMVEQDHSAFQEQIRSGLREVGGLWEDPQSWTPQGSKQRAAYQVYVQKLEKEVTLTEPTADREHGRGPDPEMLEDLALATTWPSSPVQDHDDPQYSLL